MPSLFINPQNQSKRMLWEKVFHTTCLLSIVISVSVFLLLVGITALKAVPALQKTHITLPITLSPELIPPPDKIQNHSGSYATTLIHQSLRELFPQATSFTHKKMLYKLVSAYGFEAVHKYILSHPEDIGQKVKITMLASGFLDQWRKHPSKRLSIPVHQEVFGTFAKSLQERQYLHTKFNYQLFANTDSRETETAGLLVAFIGSFYTLIIAFAVCVPLGILSAVYLEEVSKKTRFQAFLEILINNLAAVPSIVFGMIGLKIFLHHLHMPRSSSLTGGIVTAMLVLPIIIVASRESLRAVPRTLRDAALSLGATPLQTIWHHILPGASSGILTGIILGVSRAFGETAPFLLIGMVAFITQPPSTPLSVATILPVQVMMWASNPELGFKELTAIAIILLLLVLFLCNITVVIIRHKSQKTW